MYKLIFFVPESHLDKTKKSLFEIGCGVQGNYENCAWEVKGKGQFLPTEDSKPYIGQFTLSDISPIIALEVPGVVPTLEPLKYIPVILVKKVLYPQLIFITVGLL